MAGTLSRVPVVVLGAGPAGLGAALELAERGARVTVVERRDTVGGNAASFELAGIRVDYGSHRLHPAADPAVLARLRALLGDDLCERPRHGRIRLLGRWIHFPLRPADLALRLPPAFALGAAFDTLRRHAVRRGAEESFETVLERGLGPTICRDFYFPYARKIWGLAPAEIAAAQAHKRVSAASPGALLARLVGRGGGARRGSFFYPRRGYGQISERLAEAARAAGADLRLETEVRRIALSGDRAEVEVAGARGPERLAARHVWSTIPVALLPRLVEPVAPEPVRRAAARLELRALVLVYLVLSQGRFSEYDAHYFPGPEVAFTRVSEPKNYAGVAEPADRTVLCAEIPCAAGDATWCASDDELAARVLEGLAGADLPVRAPLREVAVRRLPAAYPVYRRGFEAHFERIDAWLDALPHLVSFGRQGLFAHDNAHHALYMARAAADSLSDDGSFDRAAWHRHRAVFATHVVED